MRIYLRVSRWTVATILVGGLSAAPRTAAAADGQSVDFRCPSTWALSEARYRVTARIRPLLFWTGPREIGAAVIGWTLPGRNAIRLELLIGTDPDRTPRRINRWGYVAETSCGGVVELIGLMTQSDEQTIQDADARTQGDARTQQGYRAIRASVLRGEADAEVFVLSQPAYLTYRDVRTVLDRVPPHGRPTRVHLSGDTEPGFLLAVAGVLDENLADYAATQRVRPAGARTYLYGTQRYDLTVRSSQVISSGRSATMPQSDLIETEFEIRNQTTRATNSFRITCVAAGPFARAPVRILYRPRWWLEVSLVLDGVPSAATRPLPAGDER